MALGFPLATPACEGGVYATCLTLFADDVARKAKFILASPDLHNYSTVVWARAALQAIQVTPGALLQHGTGSEMLLICVCDASEHGWAPPRSGFRVRVRV